MIKYIFILVSVVGMMVPSLVSFAQPSTECVATVKCVCEGKFSGATRVVPCPNDVSSPPFIQSQGPEGTLGVDCSLPLHDSVTPALCENLDIHCGRREKSNCLLTLPTFVTSGPPPCAHDPCIPGGPLISGCDGDTCVTQVCNSVPECCISEWGSSACAETYATSCGQCP